MTLLPGRGRARGGRGEKSFRIGEIEDLRYYLSYGDRAK